MRYFARTSAKTGSTGIKKAGEYPAFFDFLMQQSLQ
jgi:hypothetical protein